MGTESKPPATDPMSFFRSEETLDATPGDLSEAAVPSAPTPCDLGASLLAEHPRYRLIKLLGRGGMGTVYLAEHKVMERTVALKVIRPDLMARPGLLERFRREVKAAARLVHPNIVTAFDAEQAGDCHFLAMEYVAGTDLSQWLKEHGPLPPAEACDYVRQAALGLQHAHEHHMVHRDLKPQNLMRTPTGHVKILDFGLALIPRLTEDRETETGAILGSPDYLAPEQADDAHAADIRADIYSLGCTLHELLSGQPPFPGGGLLDKLRRLARDDPAPLTQIRPELAPALAAIVARMMAKDPGERYQTPAQVAAALEPWCSAESETALYIKRPAAGTGPRRHLKAAVVAVVLSVLLLGAGLAHVMLPGGERSSEITDDAKSTAATSAVAQPPPPPIQKSPPLPPIH